MTQAGTKKELSETPAKEQGEKTTRTCVAKRRCQQFTPVQRAALCLAGKLAAFALVLVVLFGGIFGLAPVAEEAMYPRLRSGDLVLYYRIQHNYVAGDVVTFRIDGVRYFGRIAAVGGDTVDVTEAGELCVNGYVQQEEIYFSTEAVQGGTTLPCTVPDGSVFILGDYRTNAVDSRTFGPLALQKLDGKAITLLRRRGI